MNNLLIAAIHLTYDTFYILIMHIFAIKIKFIGTWNLLQKNTLKTLDFFSLCNRLQSFQCISQRQTESFVGGKKWIFWIINAFLIRGK